MQFKKDVKVITPGGRSFGVIDRVVIDPKSKLVTDLVIRQGWMSGGDKIIPIDSVASATDEVVTLKAEISPEQLQTYEELHYVAVNEDELAKMDYSSTYAPAFYAYPPFGPGAFPAARIPAGPPAYRVEADTNLPQDTVALKPGANVVSSDDVSVGRVEEVFTESTTQEATHFVIARGLVFTERKLIPLAWMSQIREDEVRLSVSARQLERLPAYEGLSQKKHLGQPQG